MPQDRSDRAHRHDVFGATSRTAPSATAKPTRSPTFRVRRNDGEETRVYLKSVEGQFATRRALRYPSETCGAVVHPAVLGATTGRLHKRRLRRDRHGLDDEKSNISIRSPIAGLLVGT
jgi:hypothetical protein